MQFNPPTSVAPLFLLSIEYWTDARQSVCPSPLLPSLRLTFSGSHGHGTTLQLGIVKAERDRRQKEGGEGEKPIRSIGDRAKSTAKIMRRFLPYIFRRFGDSVNPFLFFVCFGSAGGTVLTCCSEAGAPPRGHAEVALVISLSSLIYGNLLFSNLVLPPMFAL